MGGYERASIRLARTPTPGTQTRAVIVKDLQIVATLRTEDEKMARVRILLKHRSDVGS
jgi:hypothetical protein